MCECTDLILSHDWLGAFKEFLCRALSSCAAPTQPSGLHGTEVPRKGLCLFQPTPFCLLHSAYSILYKKVSLGCTKELITHVCRTRGSTYGLDESGAMLHLWPGWVRGHALCRGVQSFCCTCWCSTVFASPVPWPLAISFLLQLRAPPISFSKDIVTAFFCVF